MKYIVITMLLFVCASSYSQNSIDSISTTMQTDLYNGQVGVSLSAKIYIQDTTAIDSIHILAGYESANGNILDQVISIHQLTLERNASGGYDYLIPFGSFSFIPPYIGAYLITTDKRYSALIQNELVN